MKSENKSNHGTVDKGKSEIQSTKENDKIEKYKKEQELARDREIKERKIKMTRNITLVAVALVIVASVSVYAGYGYGRRRAIVKK